MINLLSVVLYCSVATGHNKAAVETQIVVNFNQQLVSLEKYKDKDKTTQICHRWLSGFGNILTIPAPEFDSCATLTPDFL